MHANIGWVSRSVDLIILITISNGLTYWQLGDLNEILVIVKLLLLVDGWGVSREIANVTEPCW